MDDTEGIGGTEETGDTEGIEDAEGTAATKWVGDREMGDMEGTMATSDGGAGGPGGPAGPTAAAGDTRTHGVPCW